MSEGENSKAVALRSANLINDSTFDRIWKFYYGDSRIELKEKEEEIRQRLVNIWGLLGDILTDRKAVQAHIQWCEDKDFKIKEKTAYEDLRFAKMLFGDRRLQNKNAQKAIMSDLLLSRINARLNKKQEPGLLQVLTGEQSIPIDDIDDDVLVKLIKEYNDLNGLKEEEINKTASRPPIIINFSSDPKILKQEIEELRKKAEAANAQDITPEE